MDHIFDHPLEALLDPSLAIGEPLSVRGGANWPYTTDFYVRIRNHARYHIGHAFNASFQSTSDVPTNMYVGTYRMHRFRSCYTPIKGLTADILVGGFYSCMIGTEYVPDYGCRDCIRPQDIL